MRRIASSLIVGLVLGSCSFLPSKSSGNLGPRVSAFTVYGEKTIGTSPVSLRLAGAKIPAVMHVSKVGQDVLIKLQSNSSRLDQEAYHESSGSFAIVHGGGEHFSPPLNLLTFPMHLGDAWVWNGVLSAEGETQGARATIETESGKTEVDGELAPCIQVSVVLDLVPKTSGEQVRRKLRFWIVEERGVVRREFGDESVREPAQVAP